MKLQLLWVLCSAASTACLGRDGFDDKRPTSARESCEGVTCTGNGSCVDRPVTCICDSGYTSVGLSCVLQGCTATQRDHRVCDRGDVYFVDSCGLIEELAQDCAGAGCAGDQCNDYPVLAPLRIAGSGIRLAVTDAGGAYVAYGADTGVLHVATYDQSGAAWVEVASQACSLPFDIDVENSGNLQIACCRELSCDVSRYDGSSWTTTSLPDFAFVSGSHAIADVRIAVSADQSWVCESLEDLGVSEDNPAYSVVAYQLVGNAGPSVVTRFSQQVGSGNPGSGVRPGDAARCDVTVSASSGAFLSYSSPLPPDQRVLSFDSPLVATPLSLPVGQQNDLARAGDLFMVSFGAAVYSGPLDQLAALPGVDFVAGSRVSVAVDGSRRFASGLVASGALRLFEWTGGAWREPSSTLATTLKDLPGVLSSEMSVAGGLACLASVIDGVQQSQLEVTCAKLR